MSSVEAFRIRLFPPRGVVAAEELVERTASAARKVRFILRPFLHEHRIGFETPMDGEGWLVVLVRHETQMRLQFAVTEKVEVMRQLEADATVAAFRAHCESLISVIRKARLDRLDLEDLHQQAARAYRELMELSAKGDGQALSLMLRKPNAVVWQPDVPQAPAHLRAPDELVSVTFTIESVGENFASIVLDKGSRRVLSANRARTSISWKPLEQPTNTSTWLHRRMLRHVDVQADCSRILNRNGQLYGLALHALVKGP